MWPTDEFIESIRDLLPERGININNIFFIYYKIDSYKFFIIILL